MKICGTCKIEKPLDEYSFHRRKGRKDQYQSKCRECNKTYQREHYKKNKKYYAVKAREWEDKYKKEVYSFLMEEAKDGCVTCGEKDFRCLQFNHIDRSTKTNNISNMIRYSRPLLEIKQEIKKCEILCANCHAKVTADQFSWHSALDK